MGTTIGIRHNDYEGLQELKSEEESGQKIFPDLAQ